MDGLSHAILAKTLHTPAKILRDYTDVNLIDALTVQIERVFGGQERAKRDKAAENIKLHKGER